MYPPVQRTAVLHLLSSLILSPVLCNCVSNCFLWIAGEFTILSLKGKKQRKSLWKVNTVVETPTHNNDEHHLPLCRPTNCPECTTGANNSSDEAMNDDLFGGIGTGYDKINDHLFTFPFHNWITRFKHLV